MSRCIVNDVITVVIVIVVVGAAIGWERFVVDDWVLLEIGMMDAVRWGLGVEQTSSLRQGLWRGRTLVERTRPLLLGRRALQARCTLGVFATRWLVVGLVLQRDRDSRRRGGAMAGSYRMQRDLNMVGKLRHVAGWVRGGVDKDDGFAISADAAVAGKVDHVQV